MELRRLSYNAATEAVDDAFRSGERLRAELTVEPEPVTRWLNGAAQSIDITALVDLFEELYEIEDDGDLAATTDRWLAPRVHAALRLTRLEASDPRIWNYLSVVELPEYVRRRFHSPNKSGELTTTVDRFIARDRKKHAIARLWWTSEMFRNGPGYSPVVEAFRMQDIPNGFIGYNCFENRALAVAMVQELATLNDGRPATSKQVRMVGRRINLWLATTSLDVLATDVNTDPERILAWISGHPEPVLRDQLPKGPDDGEIDPDVLDRTRQLVREIIGLGVPEAEDTEAA